MRLCSPFAPEALASTGLLSNRAFAPFAGSPFPFSLDLPPDRSGPEICGKRFCLRIYIPACHFYYGSVQNLAQTASQPWHFRSSKQRSLRRSGGVPRAREGHRARRSRSSGVLVTAGGFDPSREGGVCATPPPPPPSRVTTVGAGVLPGRGRTAGRSLGGARRREAPVASGRAAGGSDRAGLEVKGRGGAGGRDGWKRSRVVRSVQTRPVERGREQ